MVLRTLIGSVILSLAIARLNAPRLVVPNAQPQGEFIASPRFGPDGKRVFFAYRSAPHVPTEIRSIGIDGTGERTISADSDSVFPVAFTPDGQRLIYRAENRDSRGMLAADRSQRRTRFMSCRPDGTDPRELLSFAGRQVQFVGWWSNGTKVQLIAGDSSYVMNVDGSNRQSAPAGQIWLRGGKIAAIKSDLTSARIFVSDADGGNRGELTTEVRYQARPIVSDDGRRIAFIGSSVPATPLTSGGKVFVVNVDGSGLHEVLANAARAFNFSFSPDGSKLVFEDARDDNTDIYVVDVDGKNERRLTTDPGHDELPQWSPDGKHIVFHRDVRGIFVMNADGSGARRLR